MCDDIGIPMSPLVQDLEPRQVVFGVSIDDRVLAGERRIANNRVESGIVAREDLREFDLPVERRHRAVACTQGRCRRIELLPLLL